MINPHIHTPDDGRGPRDVFLDGLEYKGVVYADTRKGVIVHYDDPPKLHKYRKRIITRTAKGRVEVVARTQ